MFSLVWATPWLAEASLSGIVIFAYTGVRCPDTWSDVTDITVHVYPQNTSRLPLTLLWYNLVPV